MSCNYVSLFSKCHKHEDTEMPEHLIFTTIGWIAERIALQGVTYKGTGRNIYGNLCW